MPRRTTYLVQYWEETRWYTYEAYWCLVRATRLLPICKALYPNEKWRIQVKEYK